MTLRLWMTLKVCLYVFRLGSNWEADFQELLFVSAAFMSHHFLCCMTMILPLWLYYASSPNMIWTVTYKSSSLKQLCILGSNKNNAISTFTACSRVAGIKPMKQPNKTTEAVQHPLAITFLCGHKASLLGHIVTNMKAQSHYNSFYFHMHWEHCRFYSKSIQVFFLFLVVNCLFLQKVKKGNIRMLNK